ncbi:unnamed protein product [Rotaria magnacalcarata]
MATVQSIPARQQQQQQHPSMIKIPILNCYYHFGTMFIVTNKKSYQKYSQLHIYEYNKLYSMSLLDDFNGSGSVVL